MKKILSIQDISCYGQCSLTVALPICSAFGVETAILPTAVLSTHTQRFKDFTVLDLTSEMEKISKHWEKEDIHFDGYYTGYMASKEQIDIVLDIVKRHRKNNELFLVDPAMADDGKLYYGFPDEFPMYMKKLVCAGDIVIPNITEACFVLGIPYKEKFSMEEIIDMCFKLRDLGPKQVIISGVSFDEEHLGCAYLDTDGVVKFYFNKHIPTHFHGTGDIFSSLVFGSLMNGTTLDEAIRVAVDFTVKAIENTLPDKVEHWYGVHFESLLHTLKKD